MNWEHEIRYMQTQMQNEYITYSFIFGKTWWKWFFFISWRKSFAGFLRERDFWTSCSTADPDWELWHSNIRQTDWQSISDWELHLERHLVWVSQEIGWFKSKFADAEPVVGDLINGFWGVISLSYWAKMVGRMSKRAKRGKNCMEELRGVNERKIDHPTVVILAHIFLTPPLSAFRITSSKLKRSHGYVNENNKRKIIWVQNIRNFQEANIY